MCKRFLSLLLSALMILGSVAVCTVNTVAAVPENTFAGFNGGVVDAAVTEENFTVAYHIANKEVPVYKQRAVNDLYLQFVGHGGRIYKEVTLAAGAAYTLSFEVKFDAEAVNQNGWYRAALVQSGQSQASNANCAISQTTGIKKLEKGNATDIAANNGFLEFYNAKKSGGDNWFTRTELEDGWMRYTVQYINTSTEQQSAVLVIGTYDPYALSNGTFALDNIWFYNNADLFNIEATAEAGGSATGGGNCFKGALVTLTAVAKKDYSFAGWYQNDIKVENAGAVFTFTAEESAVYTARFTYTGKNLIVNGDFEEPIAAGKQFTNSANTVIATDKNVWGVFKTGVFGYSRADATNAGAVDSLNGTHYLAWNANYNRMFGQIVDLEQDTEYVLSFVARVTAHSDSVPVAAGIYKDYVGAGVPTIGKIVTLEETGDWAVYTIHFTTDSTYTKPAFIVGQAAAGSAVSWDIDNVTLYKKSDLQGSAQYEESFENGSANGWEGGTVVAAADDAGARSLLNVETEKSKSYAMRLAADSALSYNFGQLPAGDYELLFYARRAEDSTTASAMTFTATGGTVVGFAVSYFGVLETGGTGFDNFHPLNRGNQLSVNSVTKFLVRFTVTGDTPMEIGIRAAGNACIVDAFKLYSCNAVEAMVANAFTYVGTSVRCAAGSVSQGLGFSFGVDNTILEQTFANGARIVEFGAVVTREDWLNEKGAENFTMDNAVGLKVKQGVAWKADGSVFKIKEQTLLSKQFRAVLTGMTQKAHYNVPFAVRPYAVVEYEGGVLTTVYGHYDADVTTSLSIAAASIYEQTQDAALKEYLKTNIIDAE